MELFWKKLLVFVGRDGSQSISYSLDKAQMKADIYIGRIFNFIGGLALTIFGHVINYLDAEHALPMTERHIYSTLCVALGFLSFLPSINKTKWVSAYKVNTYIYTAYCSTLLFRSEYSILMLLACIVAFQAILFTHTSKKEIYSYVLFSSIIYLGVFILLPNGIEFETRAFEASIFLVLMMANTAVSLLNSSYIKKLKERGVEIKKQKSLSTSIFENSTDIIWALDQKMRLLTFNGKFSRHFEELYGFVPSIGLDMSEIEPAKDQHISWIAHYRQVIEGTPTSFNTSLDIFDTTEWFEFFMMPIEQDGAIIGVSAFGRNITEEVLHSREKKSMEMALRRTEQRSQLAMEGSRDGLWDWEIATNRTYLSERYREILGLDASFENISGDSMTSLFHEDDLELITKEIDDNVQGKSNQINTEFRMLHKEGHFVWVQIRGKVFHNAEGIPIRISGFLSDISERKHTENLLQGFLASSPNGIITLDVDKNSSGLVNDFKYSLVNAKAQNLLGIQSNDLLGESSLESAGGINKLDVTSLMVESFEKSITLACKRQYMHPDKERGEIWLKILIAPLENGVSLTLSDITQKKQNEERLEFLSLVANNTDNGVVIADRHGKIEWINNGFTKITGYQLNEVIGKKPGSILQGPKTNPETVRTIRAKIKSKKPFSQEILNYNKNGEPYWVTMHITPILDEEGEISRLIALESDVTQQKEYELALKEAKESAEAAAVAKAEFLATMSHEIRTPMNAVIGMTGLLLDSSLTREQREFVETIRISGDNLLNVINDILDFSKIDSGKMELESQSFDLIETIENVLDLLGSKAQDKGLELAYDPALGVPRYIVSDPTRISQILVNLANNAIKFTAKGEVIIKVETLASPNPDHQVLQFAVTDTGIGIPPEKLSKLFKSFSQVDASTTRKYGGTGLGLAICKKLVEMMNGKIWVESEAQKGSSFFFTIEVKLSTGPRKIYPPTDIRNKKVLLVDDNPTNLKILKRQCSNWGLVPVCTMLPEEATEILAREKNIELAILDYQMPNMNGSDLAKVIRANYKKAELPIICLTSMGGSLAAEEREYFNSFLSKPVRRELLLEHISGVLSQSSPGVYENLAPKNKVEEDDQPIENLKILLAEDNIVNQKVATRILAKLGYGSEIAANGLEAIDALKMQNFNIVFMDMQMPEMDGLTATQTIRQMPEFADKQPLIVAMTANAMKGDRERCLAAGMDDYISKPVKKEQIKNMILKWFRPDGQLKKERNMEEGPIL
ncbi:MAG: response regulator [Bacteroidia bacterium]|nr:response regulator [Bacteroidia bacterium]